MYIDLRVVSRAGYHTRANNAWKVHISGREATLDAAISEIYLRGLLSSLRFSFLFFCERHCGYAYNNTAREKSVP